MAAAIQASGVEWLTCQQCARPWPFPRAPRSNIERVYTCPVCAHAEVARYQRRIAEMEQQIETSAQQGPVLKHCVDCGADVYVVGTEAEALVRCRVCKSEVEYCQGKAGE